MAAPSRNGPATVGAAFVVTLRPRDGLRSTRNRNRIPRAELVPEAQRLRCNSWSGVRPSTENRQPERYQRVFANLWFRDVKYIFDVVLQLWMFATPVVYPVRNVGEPLYTILELNPMTPIINGYRSVLFEGRLPDPYRWPPRRRSRS